MGRESVWGVCVLNQHEDRRQVAIRPHSEESNPVVAFGRLHTHPRRRRIERKRSKDCPGEKIRE